METRQAGKFLVLRTIQVSISYFCRGELRASYDEHYVRFPANKSAQETEIQVNYEGRNEWVFSTEGHPLRVSGTAV